MSDFWSKAKKPSYEERPKDRLKAKRGELGASEKPDCPIYGNGVNRAAATLYTRWTTGELDMKSYLREMRRLGFRGYPDVGGGHSSR